MSDVWVPAIIAAVVAALVQAAQWLAGYPIRSMHDTDAEQSVALDALDKRVTDVEAVQVRHEARVTMSDDAVLQRRNDVDATHKEIWQAINERVTHRELDDLKAQLGRLEDKSDAIYDHLLGER